MKNQLTFLIGILIVGGLIAQFTMFQLPYNEVAVVTTFNKANEDSVLREPGLKFRWPPPIQQVRRYSKNLHMHNMVQREVSTQDKHSLEVSTYVAWTINDPLKFFVKLNSVLEAESQIDSLLRKENVIGEYRMDQIVNTDPEAQKITEIEQEMADRLAKSLADNDYGITVHRVGLQSIELPKKVTAKVFVRMINERVTLAAATRQEGIAAAAQIKSAAESKSTRIMAFANRYAERLRAEGDAESREILKVFEENQQFATFILRTKALEKMLSGEDTPITLFLSDEMLDFDKMLQDLTPPTPAKSATDGSNPAN